MAAAKRGDVEADRDRVIATDDLDAEHLTQSDVQAVGDHHQPRRNHLVVGKDDLLAVVAGRNRNGLAIDQIDVVGDFAADGVDQRITGDTELLARRLVEQPAVARDPVFAVVGCLRKNRFRQSRLAQACDLFGAAQFFHAIGVSQGAILPIPPIFAAGMGNKALPAIKPPLMSG